MRNPHVFSAPFLRLLLAATLLGSTAPLALADPAPASPFAEGTTRRHLSDADRAMLEEYRTAKSRLEKALKEATRGTTSEELDILLPAIRQVVARSHQLRPRSEFLMRMVLNQALALTYGVPTADGSGIEVPAVLPPAYRELKARILEDSVKLALEYYEDDRQAVESGAVGKQVDLPFNRIALARLSLLRERWLPMIGDDWQVAYGVMVAGLYQWLSFADHSQNLHKAVISAELADLDAALSRAEEGPQRPAGDELAARVRDLRRAVHDAIDSLKSRGL